MPQDDGMTCSDCGLLVTPFLQHVCQTPKPDVQAQTIVRLRAEVEALCEAAHEAARLAQSILDQPHDCFEQECETCATRRTARAVLARLAAYDAGEKGSMP